MEQGSDQAKAGMRKGGRQRAEEIERALVQTQREKTAHVGAVRRTGWLRLPRHTLSARAPASGARALRARAGGSAPRPAAAAAALPESQALPASRCRRSQSRRPGC